MRLSCDAVDEKPIYYDWFKKEYGTDFDIVFPKLTEEEIESGEYLDEFAPMINYYYPLPKDGRRYDEKDAEKIRHLPLSIIYFPNEDLYALALTGGGMNLSWEICEAYILLGYLPPISFCDLPNMADKEYDSRNKRIIEACKESLKHTQLYSNQVYHNLENLEESLKRNVADV